VKRFVHELCSHLWNDIFENDRPLSDTDMLVVLAYTETQSKMVHDTIVGRFMPIFLDNLKGESDFAFELFKNCRNPNDILLVHGIETHLGDYIQEIFLKHSMSAQYCPNLLIW